MLRSLAALAAAGAALLLLAPAAVATGAAPAASKARLYPAFEFFPGGDYDTPLTRSYAGARGTVTVPDGKGSEPPCQIVVSGLRPTSGYIVYLDADGSTRGKEATAGPFSMLGALTSDGAGNGGFRCSTAPRSGASVYINEAAARRTVLISDNLAGGQAGPAPAAGKPLETIVLSFTDQYGAYPGIPSRTRFDPTHTYRLTISGEGSFRYGKGNFTGPNYPRTQDAFYCYGYSIPEGKCGSSPTWDHRLWVDGTPLNEFVGVPASKIPYRSDHRYQIDIKGKSGQIRFRINADVNLISRYSGAWRIEIADLTPAGPTTGRLELRYSMPKRFGIDANRDGLVDYVTAPVEVSPRRWTALVEVRRKGGRACDPAAKYEWAVGGRPAAFERKQACVFAYERFPKLGTYDVAVTATKGKLKETGFLSVTLKDWLIFGLGDSNGSGEGNPDVPGTRSPRWQDRRCDRSARSFQAVAARLIEDADPRSSVTFVHLACSGASIVKGMIGPYRGINDPGGLPIQSQLGTMQKLKGEREVDAVLLSIGINDLGFGEIVKYCLRERNCQVGRLDRRVDEKMRVLPSLYQQLAERLGRLKIPLSRIFVTQYPDPTHYSDDPDRFCDPLIEVDANLKATLGYDVFDFREARWAFLSVLVPLNGRVAQAAEEHGWRLVTGAQEGFLPHGYCSEQPWIVGLVESLRDQGDQNGTLHPNAAGHLFTARLVIAALKRAGIPR